MAILLAVWKYKTWRNWQADGNPNGSLFTFLTENREMIDDSTSARASRAEERADRAAHPENYLPDGGPLRTGGALESNPSGMGIQLAPTGAAPGIVVAANVIAVGAAAPAAGGAPGSFCTSCGAPGTGKAFCSTCGNKI